MNAQIREEAADWLVEFRLDEPDTAAREQFANWLRASPEHVRVYLELVAFWEDAGRYDSDRRIDVDSLIALSRSDTNVIVLDGASDVAGSRTNDSMSLNLQTVPRARRHRYVVAGTAAAVAAVLLGGWLAFEHDPRYITDVGEQRTVRLSDGSIAELNALSRIRVRFSSHERIVDLVQGQALFKVAKESSRPFVVVSGETRVRAVGTEFDVNRRDTATVVTVLEGRVAIVSAADSTTDEVRSSGLAAPLEASAGEQVAVTHSTPSKTLHANVTAATAWTQQQLIFEAAPLAEVAEEFNRFNTQKLVVEGEHVRALTISGNFPALDPTSLTRFVRFLRAQPGVEILESHDRIVVSQK